MRSAFLPVVLGVLAGLAAGSMLAAQEPVDRDVIPVSIELTPEEITVGDRVIAKLTLVWDGEAPASEPRFPAWQETWGDAEILAIGEVENFSDPNGRQVYTQTLALTAFETGEVDLPRRVVALPLGDGTVEIPTRENVGFTVRSVLPEDAAAEAEAPSAPGAAGLPGAPGAPGAAPAGGGVEPRPTAPLRRLEGDGRSLLANGLLLLLAGVAVFFLLRRLGRAVAEAIAARRLLPPYEEFVQNTRQVDVAAGPEPTATAMSYALRRYLGRRLEIPAVESTTSEIQRLLRDRLPREQVQGVLKLLRDADQVKFARIEITALMSEERLAELRRLGREIEAELRPPEPAEGEAADATGKEVTA